MCHRRRLYLAFRCHESRDGALPSVGFVGLAEPTHVTLNGDAKVPAGVARKAISMASRDCTVRLVDDTRYECACDLHGAFVPAVLSAVPRLSSSPLVGKRGSGGLTDFLEVMDLESERNRSVTCASSRHLGQPKCGASDAIAGKNLSVYVNGECEVSSID